MMRQATIDNWVEHNVPKEGRLLIMYLDIVGLVTTGVGNLVDPAQLAMVLAWLRADGTRASEAEIRAEHALLKSMFCGRKSHPVSCAWEGDASRVCLAHKGWRAAARVAKLRITEKDVGALCRAKLIEMWGHLATRVPTIITWPVDAQTAILSMAWGMGPAFNYPRFFEHAKRGDFLGMLSECTIREEGNPGVKPRNASNRVLFENAHIVTTQGLDPDVMYYPERLATSPRVRVAEELPRVRIEVPEPVHHGDALTEDEALGFYESDGGFARRQMLSEFMVAAVRDEITKRNSGD